ncbi:hypothetical protein AWG33_04155 [Escherichia coli]|nr:hypothetical protein AWG33_04155 [Escherichia coli]
MRELLARAVNTQLEFVANVAWQLGIRVPVNFVRAGVNQRHVDASNLQRFFDAAVSHQDTD